MDEIIQLVQTIFENLGLQLEINIQDLFENEIYNVIYQTMFPFLIVNLKKIDSSNLSNGEKIQSLIDLLAADILTMDLSHIQGKKIAEGDEKHLLNFIQLIFELSKLFLMRNENNPEMQKMLSTPGSRNEISQLIGKEEDELRRHTIIGIDEELQGFDKQQDQQQLQQEQQMIQKEETKKSKNQQQKKSTKKKQKQKSHQEVSSKKQELDEEKLAELLQEFSVNNPEILKLAEEQGITPEQLIQMMAEAQMNENLFASENQQNYDNKGGKDINMNDFEDWDENEQQQEVFNIQEGEKQTVEENLNIDDELNQEEELYEKLQSEQKPDKKDEIKLSELVGTNEEQEKFENELIKQKNDKSNDEIEILQSKNLAQRQDSYSKIKEELDNLNEMQINENDPIAKQKLLQQRNEYKKLLQQYLAQQQQQQQSQVPRVKKRRYKKSIVPKKQFQPTKSRSQYINENIAAESLFHYSSLKDKKINYLKKIHRIIFELEKNKLIDSSHQYKQNLDSRAMDTQSLLASLEQSYQSKIALLSEKIKAQRVERHLADYAQKQVIKDLAKEMKNEWQQSVMDMRNMWSYEKEKFDMIVKDDGFLERKIMELYRKY